jgi:hypothetical protein
MKRWQARLAQHPSVDDTLVDDYYAFFECCYHLKDWLKTDTLVDQSVREKIENHLGPSLALCADIANGSKHLVRRPGAARVDPHAQVSTKAAVFSPAVYDPRVYQTRDQVIVRLNDRDRDALDVVTECVREWEDFLKANGLL